MDASIPASAAALLDLIGSKEAPQGYGTIYRNRQGDLPKALTLMTLAEVISAGPSWASAYGSSACGRYQFLTQTLKRLRAAENFSGSEIFGPNFQDRLGYALLDERGYERFLRGQLSVNAFGLGLAKEWASFPVLADVQGAHRLVRRGETYYAGDTANRALISPEEVERALSAVSNSPVVAASGDASASPLVERLSTLATLDPPAPQVPTSTASGEVTEDANAVPGRVDGEAIQRLIELASDQARLHDAQSKAAQKLLAYDGEIYPRDGCAITLSVLLQNAGIGVADTFQALALGNLLKKRGWKTIQVGSQKAGDVGSTCGRVAQHGKDHIYLVLQVLNSDEMVIADNQQTQPHFRFASGQGGKTPTKFFLRAPST